MRSDASENPVNESPDKLSDIHLDEIEKSEAFERLILPHLDSAHNLARWLAGNDQDAEDIVQESFSRAYRFFAGFRGGDPRAWLLTIVRHTSYSWLRKNRSALAAEFDEETHAAEETAADPQAILVQNATLDAVRSALAALPAEFREAFVLREIEGLTYKQIAEVADIPIGTVMSRLARARALLQQRLRGFEAKEERP
jgi:RNA polymerase sigma-70 factor (ECF subfamily)